MSKALAALVLASAILTQSSCFVLKRGGRNKEPKALPVAIQPADSVKKELPVAAADTVGAALMRSLVPLWNRQTSFSTFSGKAKMNVSVRGQKHDLVAHIRIKKDEAIWASVFALEGIVQVARVLITPDSVKMLNYLEKEAVVKPIAEITKMLPATADYNTLQNLILGNVLRREGTPTHAAGTAEGLVLQVEDNTILQKAVFHNTDSTLQLLQMQSVAPNGPAGVLRFSNYQTLDGKLFSTARIVNVMNDQEQFYLDMDFNKVDFDKPVELPFSIPRNFERK